MDKNKKIIGYKAPFDLLGGIIKKGDIFKEWSDKGLVYYFQNEECGNALPKEIVEKWEPVYEEKQEDLIEEIIEWCDKLMPHTESTKQAILQRFEIKKK